MLDTKHPRKTLSADGLSLPAVCCNALDETGTRAEDAILADTGIDISFNDCDLYAVMDAATWASWNGLLTVGTAVEFGGKPFLVSRLLASFDDEGNLTLVSVNGRPT